MKFRTLFVSAALTLAFAGCGKTNVVLEQRRLAGR